MSLLSSEENRRGFFQRLGSWFMGLGLLAGYGTFTAFIARYLLPSQGVPRSWQFVTDLGSFHKGGALPYVSPAGEKALVTRINDAGDADDFIALSSVCPHLGCQVHWEEQNSRFFCPCHNGAFDAEGRATAGPPKDANQSLARYPLKVENDLLFIEVETQPLVQQQS